MRREFPVHQHQHGFVTQARDELLEQLGDFSGVAAARFTKMTPENGECKTIVNHGDDEQVDWSDTKFPLGSIYRERDVIWVEAE